MITVAQLIEQLQKCDLNSSVEISVGQSNSVYPVVYLEPLQVINKQNGHDTRIKVRMPEDKKVINQKIKK